MGGAPSQLNCRGPLACRKRGRSCPPLHPPSTFRIQQSQNPAYVEDNASNVKLKERIIAQRPHVRMITAQQGNIALKLARQHRPDVVLLDLHLPDMNGDQVLGWLRSDPETAGIPVVMLSADATEGEQERLKELGACAYITKPFQVPNLLQVIDSALAGGVTTAP